ncbi:MAG: hypothetical protein K1X74_22770 [Pirellulales bacterium]|nr:hypothetical protein [Pirellulales bacterium]
MAKQSADNAKDGAAAAKAPLWKRPFAWLAGNRARAVRLLLVAANVLAAGGLIWLVFFYGRGKIDVERTLAASLAALDEHDYFRAKALAEALLTPGVKLSRERGGPAFVLGAVASAEADESWDPEQTEFYTVAARHLHEASRAGCPKGREAQCLYLLGRSLYFSHQLAEAKLVLESALARAPQYRAPVLRLLVEANLADDPPDLAEAQRFNQELLAIGGLIPAARQRALLQRARILLPQRRLDEIVEIVAQVPATSQVYPEAITILGEVRLNEARRLRPAEETGEPLPAEALAKYQEAIRLYREALSQATLSSDDSRRAEFLVGLALYEAGEPRAAREQFVRTRKLHPRTPEGLAANAREAELRLAEGLYPEALAALVRAVRAAGDPAQ